VPHVRFRIDNVKHMDLYDHDQVRKGHNGDVLASL
jgi:hypothetical protein